MENKADSPEVVVASFVWICCLVSLINGIRIYKEKKSWANNIILGSVCGHCFAQSINLFGISLGVFDGVLGMKIFYVIGYMGMCLHLLMSLHRFQIFGAMLPFWVQNSLRLKNYGPAIGIFAILCWVPMTIHVTSSEPFSQSRPFFIWTMVMFFSWMLLWIVIDNVVTVWSLKLVITVKKGVGHQKLTSDQERSRNICLILLMILLICDLIAWPEMTFWAVLSFQAGFLTASSLRRIVSLSGSLLVFHMLISYAYMHYIFRLILSKSRPELKSNIILDHISGPSTEHGNRTGNNHDKLAPQEEKLARNGCSPAESTSV